MDIIDDIVNQVKATARQAAEGVRDQADAAAKALEEPSEVRDERNNRTARLSEVGDSIRGTVPKASVGPKEQRTALDRDAVGTRKPWRE